MDNVLKNTVLTDGNGNYYEQMYYSYNEQGQIMSNPVRALKNIVTGSIYIQNELDGDTIIYKLLNGTTTIPQPTIEVWQTSANGLSVLAFENNLFWLKTN